MFSVLPVSISALHSRPSTLSRVTGSAPLSAAQERTAVLTRPLRGRFPIAAGTSPRCDRAVHRSSSAVVAGRATIGCAASQGAGHCGAVQQLGGEQPPPKSFRR